MDEINASLTLSVFRDNLYHCLLGCTLYKVLARCAVLCVFLSVFFGDKTMFTRMSPWWSLCTLYSLNARWSYRRRLGSLLSQLWACVQCHVWRQLFECNYFPLFVDSMFKPTTTKAKSLTFKVLFKQIGRLGQWMKPDLSDLHHQNVKVSPSWTTKRSVGTVTEHGPQWLAPPTR